MSLDSKYITISGQPTFEQQKITFPSGEFGIGINAFLSSMNAQFGFGGTPHRFDLEYIPESFSSTQLPTIGSGVNFTIGDNFYIKGEIVHADYTSSARGKIISISVEDTRLDLDDIILDTYGVFGNNDAPSNNIVDVRYWYTKQFLESRNEGRTILLKDLNLLDQHGASYRQIYEAIQYFEQTQGTISNVLSKIPKPEVVEEQLDGDPNSYKWHFRSQPLLQCLGKILNDVAYDFYWNMQESKINVINRKLAVNISENAIPVSEDTAPIISKRYGKDEGERPTAIRVFGSEMEGIIGYGSVSGAFGLSSIQYNLGLGDTTLRFSAAWRNVKIKYFGPDGSVRTNRPSDRDLGLALKGIEFWAAEQDGLDNRLSKDTVSPADDIFGRTVRNFNPTSSTSRLGLIKNRGITERGWVIAWYNRVRTFAQNYFGRAYTLDTNTNIYQRLDEIEVVPAAWCNIENLAQGGIFTDNYKIDSAYRGFSPFWDSASNRMKGFAILPWDVKWGADGKGQPAQFEQFNEIGGQVYVPIEVRQWSVNNKKFDESFLEPIYKQEKGIMIFLPNLAWDVYNKEDSKLLEIPLLQDLRLRFQGDTNRDFEDPMVLPDPLERLSKVGIPVKVNRRYGYSYPSVWASGTGNKVEMLIDDDFAPWNYEPRGNQTSVQLLNEDVRSVMNSQVVDRNQVTFAEAQKVGLPYVSFDSFANQNKKAEGYGVVSHGITTLNISKSVDGWWQTRYNIKSHFPQFVKAKPITDAPDEDLNFILHRWADKIRRTPPPIPPFKPLPIQETSTEFGTDSAFPSEILDKFERVVTISEVFNRGGNEYYAGIDESSIKWPRALDSIYNSDSFQSIARIAHCIDGFLQVGMQAIYHYEEQADNQFVHYFTGGVDLTSGRVVELSSAPRLLNEVWVASCRTLATEVDSPLGGTQIVEPFNFKNVPFMFQQAVDTGMTEGDKVMMASHGNKSNLVPDGDYGPTGTQNGDAYLANNSVPGDTLIGYVITTPNVQNGRGGAIGIIDAAGGTIYQDGGTVGGNQYNVFFVGVEYDQVEKGDYCVIKQYRESAGSAFRLYCLIQKPLFMGRTAWGGEL